MKIIKILLKLNLIEKSFKKKKMILKLKLESIK